MRHFFVCSSAALLLVAAAPVQAHGTHEHHAQSAHGVHVHDCWVRLMPAGLPSAAYFRLDNRGAEMLALTAVDTDAYARVMLHATRTAGGMSHMDHVDAVPVPAHGTVEFAPGGYHVMLEDATRALDVGQSIVLQFKLADAAPVLADCVLRAANAVGGAADHPAHPRGHAH